MKITFRTSNDEVVKIEADLTNIGIETLRYFIMQSKDDSVIEVIMDENDKKKISKLISKFLTRGVEDNTDVNQVEIKKASTNRVPEESQITDKVKATETKKEVSTAEYYRQEILKLIRDKGVITAADIRENIKGINKAMINYCLNYLMKHKNIEHTDNSNREYRFYTIKPNNRKKIGKKETTETLVGEMEDFLDSLIHKKVIDYICNKKEIEVLKLRKLFRYTDKQFVEVIRKLSEEKLIELISDDNENAIYKISDEAQLYFIVLYNIHNLRLNNKLEERDKIDFDKICSWANKAWDDKNKVCEILNSAVEKGFLKKATNTEDECYYDIAIK